jgi:predicted transcriptional regulator
MDSKSALMVEVSKTVTRCKNKGIDPSGFRFGFANTPNTALNLPTEEKKPDSEVSENTAKNDEQVEKLKWNENEPYVKMFRKQFASLALELSSSEFAITIILTEYISYETGLIKKHSGTPIDMQDIEELTGFSKKTVIKAMQKLLSKKIVFRGRTGNTENDPYQFYANPHIFFRGRYINSTLIAMFKDYKKK